MNCNWIPLRQSVRPSRSTEFNLQQVSAKCENGVPNGVYGNKWANYGPEHKLSYNLGRMCRGKSVKWDSIQSIQKVAAAVRPAEDKWTQIIGLNVHSTQWTRVFKWEELTAHYLNWIVLMHVPNQHLHLWITELVRKWFRFISLEVIQIWFLGSGLTVEWIKYIWSYHIPLFFTNPLNSGIWSTMPSKLGLELHNKGT